MEDKVKDNYDRPILSLRISITNRCNLDCIYCHHDGMLNSSLEMTPDEIYQICRIAKKLGVEKIRLSGGEPLVRKDIVEIVSGINDIGFQDISITTNGIFLNKYIEDLYEAGLDRINVSLDTLSPLTYKKITSKNHLEEVKEGIIKSIQLGISPVKINMVIMKDINDTEIMDLFEFSKKHGIILQLIELIESESCNDNEFNSEFHFKLDKFESYLAEIADEIKVRKNMQDRKKYFIEGGEIEVVHPVDNTNFCKNCTRLRITPEGKIKPCLLRNDNLVDLIKFIRQDYSDEKLIDIFLKAIGNREPYYKE